MDIMHTDSSARKSECKGDAVSDRYSGLMPFLSDQARSHMPEELPPSGNDEGMRVPSSQPGTIWSMTAGVLVAMFSSVAIADSGLPDWVEFSGKLSTEAWHYPDKGLYPDQRSYAGGVSLETTVFMEYENGNSFTLTPFFRSDAGDPDRAIADLREAYFLTYGEVGDGEWEIRLGFDQVFWGVVESRSLVDIVNQTDVVGHPNEKTKLSQPMAHLTWSEDWGVLELFGITWHRERPYPGRHGRQRTGLVVNPDLTTYEADSEEWHIDLAGRFSGQVGAIDVGISLFDGTSREPSLVPTLSGSHQVLAPHYEQIRQYGLDAQLTTESMLLKLEAIHRTGAKNSRFDTTTLGYEEEDYTAFVLGGEYAFYSILDSNTDLVLFAEWFQDSRGRWSTNAFEDDLFLAAQFALNDVQSTEFILSSLISLDNSSHFLGAEFKRRLTDNWYLHFETSHFQEIAETDAMYPVRGDSFFRLNLDYSF